MNKAYVYRYIDKKDGIVKYYGIVYGERRTLLQRLKEHERDEEWCRNGSWIIEYIEVRNRTEAEAYESHYIASDKTYNYFNKAKANWGECSFIPNREGDWKEVSLLPKDSECIYFVALTEDSLLECPDKYKYIIKPIAVKKRYLKKHSVDNSFKQFFCKECGSDNIFWKTSSGFYCDECGKYIYSLKKQEEEEAKKYYTPFYNGLYETINGDIIVEERYSFINTRCLRWTNSMLKSDLETVRYSNTVGAYKEYIHTYALLECNIDDAKQRIIEYVKNKFENDIQENLQEIIELKHSIKAKKMKSIELSDKYNLFLSRYKVG